MQFTTDEFAKSATKGSFIRRMFEKGIELKAQYGEDAVCDFSLGNPDLPPPAAAKEALEKIASAAVAPYGLGYCPNAGIPQARAAIAAQLSKEQGVAISRDGIVLTVGAAGGIVCVFRAIVSPGDEIIVPSPYFVEYGNYCGHFGGVLKPVPSKPDFSLDLTAIEAAICSRTRAVLVNSPNNPTGAIYSAEEIDALSGLVERENARRAAKGERALVLISDEPYRAFAYDGAQVPSILGTCRHAIVVGSFSKTLSMAGERIGYVVPSPAISEGDGGALVSTLVLVNRTLGFVNAPVLGQRLAAAICGEKVDVSVYERRRALMAEVLDGAGIDYTMPKGAFYFFPAAPGGDDVKFVDALLRERILAVPGSGFGRAGHIRLSYSVEDAVIARSAAGFKRAAEACR